MPKKNNRDEYEIVSSSNNLNKTSYIEKEIVSTDYETGEVTASSKVIVRKTKGGDQFLKLFLENLEFIANELTNTEKNIFLAILKSINYSNVMIDNADTRKFFASFTNQSLASISRGLASLKEKKVLLYLDTKVLTKEELDFFGIIGGGSKYWLINPNLIGRGSFREMAYMKQIVIKDFDFKTNTLKKQINNHFEYRGFGDVVDNPEGHVIDYVNIEKNENNNIETEIGIYKKEEAEEEFKGNGVLIDSDMQHSEQSKQMKERNIFDVELEAPKELVYKENTDLNKTTDNKIENLKNIITQHAIMIKNTRNELRDILKSERETFLHSGNLDEYINLLDLL